MNAKSASHLDVHQDIAHQKIEWGIEWVSWAFIFLVLLAAVLGLLGPGPLSWVERESPDKLVRFEYVRIARYQSPELLRVHVSGEAAREGEIRLNVNRRFIDSVQITRIEPEPQRVIAGQQFHTYVFDASEAGEPTTIQFHHELQDYEKIPLAVGLARGSPARLNVLVLP